MIRTGQNTQLVDPGTVRKQWIEFALLIGGTGLLLAIVFVGLALPVWRLLFQTLRQFAMLQAQQGIGAAGLLCLLVFQAGFSLAAWGLFAWIAVRGGMRLRATASHANSQFDMPPMMDAAALNQPIAPAQVAGQTAVPGLSMPPTVVQTPTVPPQPLPHVQVTMMPDPFEKLAFMQYPFTAPRTAAPVSQAPIPTAEEQKVHPKRAEVTNEATVLRPNPLSSNNRTSRWQEPPSHLSQQATQRQPGNSETQGDPFAVNEDAVKLFLRENALPKSKEQPEQKPGFGIPNPEFLFGNPFEGLLPDVFEHDEDLKRSIKEQHRNIYQHSAPDA